MDAETRPVAPVLPPVPFDAAAAAAVLDSRSTGLRALAEAGGLDPARDFAGLDLRGWDLAEQDLRGFDLRGCDLRETGIECARIDATTRLDQAVCDDGVVPGGQWRPSARHDLKEWRKWAYGRYQEGDHATLRSFGRHALPLLIDAAAAIMPEVLRLQAYVGRAEAGLGDPHVLVRLRSVLASSADEGRDDELAVLFVRHEFARALLLFGRPGDALAEIDALVPLRAEVEGPRDSNTLATRHLRAQVLSDLGRPGDALAEIDALLPLRAEVKGLRHPNTLTTRYLRAQVLSELGRPGDALAEIDTLLPLEEEVKGRDHRDTLLTRALAAELRRELGDPEAAVAELSAILPVRPAPGDDNPYQRARTLLWLARVEADLGRSAEASAHVEDGLAALHFAPEHRITRELAALRERLARPA